MTTSTNDVKGDRRRFAGRRILMLLENESYPDDSRVPLEADSLRDAGYHVTVICPTGTSRKKYENVNGVDVYRYPKPRELNGLAGYLWEYSYSLAMTFVISLYVFCRSGFDAVHTHCPPDMFVVIAAFYKLLGKKYVVDLHDLSPELYEAKHGSEGSRLVRSVLCLFERWSCRLADRLIATNTTQREIQIRRGGAAPEKCFVVRNGPNERFFKSVDPVPALRDGRFVIGYVGVIGTQDGVDYLIRALDHLRRSFGREQFRCVIVGGGPAVDDLKQLIANLGLQQHVEFTGFIMGDDLLRHIESFDVSVTPDHSNSYNDSCTTIKTMEYMAMAKPVVAFDLPENRVSAADSALYATNNCEREFASLIVKLWDDPQLRTTLGQRGRQRIRDHFTWEVQSKTLVALYDGLLQPGVSAKTPTAPKSAATPAWPEFAASTDSAGDRNKVLV
jgi:glycosyltransferase involved in cell wall biosynthesis